MPGNIPIHILDQGIGLNELKLLEDWGKYLATDEKSIDRNGRDKVSNKQLTTSQIRKFFGEIKRVQADFKNLSPEILLLDPKIAYAVGRVKKEGKNKLEDFYKQVSPLLRAIDQDEKKFKNFVNIIESLVAFHKAYGGN